MRTCSHILLSTFLSTSLTAFAGDKIVGGEKVADKSETPYFVSLDGVCGGSIIAKHWILTAAHCAGHFKNAKGGILNIKETGYSYKIKKVTKHPQFDSKTMVYDYALAEIDGNIDFAATGLKPVKLATPEFEAAGHQKPGMDTTVYGFGLLNESDWDISPDLNKVVVPIVSNDDANTADAYAGQIKDTMIAAGYADGGKDSCQGDSGGPLVVFDGNKEPVLVGIVSWGEGCARAHKYGIYSKVSAGYKWIQDTIKGK